MRISLGVLLAPTSWMIAMGCLLAPGWSHGQITTQIPAQKESGSIQLKEGVITIRALADRQRKLEEAEFLNRLNPSSGNPANTQSSFRPLNSQGSAAAPGGQFQDGQGGTLDASGSAAPAVQELPVVRGNQAGSFTPPMPVQVLERPMPVNTVLSVYGQEGKLTAEVALKGGKIALYRVGDAWNGYRITQISRDGVAVLKLKGGASERLIPVGGTL